MEPEQKVCVEQKETREREKAEASLSGPQMSTRKESGLSSEKTTLKENLNPCLT